MFSEQGQQDLFAGHRTTPSITSASASASAGPGRVDSAPCAHARADTHRTTRACNLAERRACLLIYLLIINQKKPRWSGATRARISILDGVFSGVDAPRPTECPDHAAHAHTYVRNSWMHAWHWHSTRSTCSPCGAAEDRSQRQQQRRSPTSPRGQYMYYYPPTLSAPLEKHADARESEGGGWLSVSLLCVASMDVIGSDTDGYH